MFHGQCDSRANTVCVWGEGAVEGGGWRERGLDQTRHSGLTMACTQQGAIWRTQYGVHTAESHLEYPRWRAHSRAPSGEPNMVCTKQGAIWRNQDGVHTAGRHLAEVAVTRQYTGLFTGDGFQNDFGNQSVSSPRATLPTVYAAVLSIMPCWSLAPSTSA